MMQRFDSMSHEVTGHSMILINGPLSIDDLDQHLDLDAGLGG
jgi:hypothetical protein